MTPTCLACILRAEEYCDAVAMGYDRFDDLYWEFHENHER